MKIHIILMFLCAMMLNTTAQGEGKGINYVNPLIGTKGMGHVFPGACVPLGGIQLSPDTEVVPHSINGAYQKGTYAYCAGYQYEDKTIVGFSHRHFSGTGHSDLGDILIMPTIGDLKLVPGTAENPESGYRSRFSHEREKARPGYYEVDLLDYGIKAQLTATERTGVHKYTYPKDKDGRIILDLNHGIYNFDGKTLWAHLRVENDTLITGYRITNGWARTNYVYFAISLSQPIKDYGYVDHADVPYNGFWRRFKMDKNFPEIAGRKIVSYFNFDTKANPELTVKVGISAVSTEGALKNLRAETENKTFEELAQEAYNSWDKEFKAIDVQGTDDQKAMFYTSFYHTLINPSVYEDVDGKYRGLDHNIHEAKDFTNYTIFSLWDTYRAEHPFLNLMKTKENTDMIVSMLKHQEQSVHGMLPIWSHMANENWCMSGYHSVSAIADAIIKGADIDKKVALKAMEKTSKVSYYEGLDDFRWLGYVPLDRSGVGASTTLEYAYDDWTIYNVALAAGDETLAREYRKRALNYRNIYDRELGFARPKYSNGSFKPNFDILQTHGEGFIEGNSWNFSFHVPHDVFGIVSLMGGDKVFTKKLDKLFEMDLPGKYYEHNEDITKECLLGGYVHGNEPSHHIPYLYAWTSQPWKTQYWVREIMNRMYKNKVDGLSGNDDCGQMSAWYMFTAMGFYPVCPGADEYVLGAPYLPYLKLTLPNGKVFEIKAPKVSDKNRYVRSVKLNGKSYPKMYLKHKDILAGGEIEFVMSSSPNKSRGRKVEDKPYSLTDGSLADNSQWDDYFVGDIIFEDKAKGTKGSDIYNHIFTDPKSYISDKARVVLNTLYFSPKDSIVPVRKLNYSLENINGVSAKGGGNGEITIWYSTQHIEKSFAKSDTAKLDYETRGVLLHELTHAYQLEPQGVGNYGSSDKIFWAFIEGMADAVRVANGCFAASDRPVGGSYMDGYRNGGFFFVWIRDKYDADFLRKFNRSALEVIPWSFDGAIKKVLGKEFGIDELWREYQLEMGDISN